MRKTKKTQEQNQIISRQTRTCSKMITIDVDQKQDSRDAIQYSGKKRNNTGVTLIFSILFLWL